MARCERLRQAGERARVDVRRKLQEVRRRRSRRGRRRRADHRIELTMASDGRTVSDVGEQGLLELLSSRLKPPPSGSVWSGDDAAVVDVFSDRAVLTTDLIVEDVDFRLDTFGP